VIPGQMRAIVMSLPEVLERQTWGKPTFRVQNKLFVTLAPDGSSAVRGSPRISNSRIRFSHEGAEAPLLPLHQGAAR
jgi:hypothetical protein